MSPPKYLGTATGLTGIPSLLLSTLQQVQDPEVQRALYQIQNWANSLGQVQGIVGTGSASLGANCPATVPSAPSTWTNVSLNGVPAYIPVWA
jgi:hypothetical protein